MGARPKALKGASMTESRTWPIILPWLSATNDKIISRSRRRRATKAASSARLKAAITTSVIAASSPCISGRIRGLVCITHLALLIILDAYPFNQFKLRFQMVNMFFFRIQNALQHIPGDIIPYFFAISDGIA